MEKQCKAELAASIWSVRFGVVDGKECKAAFFPLGLSRKVEPSERESKSTADQSVFVTGMPQG